MTHDRSFFGDGPPTPSAQAYPKVIFLDAVGTLFGVRDSVGAQYAQILARFGWQGQAKAIDRAFFAAFKAAPPCVFPGLTGGELRAAEYDWWRTIARQTLSTPGTIVLPSTPIASDQVASDHVPPDQQESEQRESEQAIQAFLAIGSESFEAFFQGLFDYFATAEPWSVYPETRSTLTHWRSLGIDLGVISNFDQRLHPVLWALNLTEYFSSITLSTEVGAAKPDPRVFMAALAKHACRPEQAWHVGDSFEDDYQGARSAGLRAVWLKR